MPKFQWEGVTRSGETRKGVMEATGADAVEARLRGEQITPKSVRRSLGSVNLNLSFGSGVTTKDLLVFTRQLSTMIDAGLPLVQCLDILANQAETPAFSKVLFKVKNSVESGSTFSEALRRHPKVFDDLYVNLVAAGEVGGILDTILTRLSAYIEKAVKLKRQVKSAMVYPTVILCVALGVVAVMLGKVIPTFETMYQNFDNAALPRPTQIVIDISRSFTNNWYWYFGSVAAILVGLSAMLRSPRGREAFDAGILHVPVVGSVLRKVVVARFTRTLGTLLSSGVPILDALDICARTAGNKKVEKAVLYARAQIATGKDMGGPLGETKVFPPMVTQMIGVGEQTGAMDQMLQKIADFYEDEVDTAVAALTSLMEPIMIVVLGGIMGVILIAMYMPIFELAGNIRGT
jgi:type IV pilus assembly protein PilC